jgi:hypothetical protein
MVGSSLALPAAPSHYKYRVGRLQRTGISYFLHRLPFLVNSFSMTSHYSLLHDMYCWGT